MDIENMSPSSGRAIKEDGMIVNTADMLESIYTALCVDKNAGVLLNGNLATSVVAITPSDSTDLAKKPTKGIYVGVSGDLVVTMSDGTTATYTGLSSGMVHPISVNRIKATGTTATNILAVY